MLEDQPVASHRIVGLTLLVGLASALGTLLLFAWIAEEMLEGGTRAFDDWVRLGIHQYASPALTSLMRFITILGSPPFLMALSACAVLGFMIVGSRRYALLFLVTAAGAVLLDVMLKFSFRRPRPAPFFGVALPTSYSFPSGHALGSFCVYGVLAAFIAAHLRNRVARLVVWTLSVVLIALIGLSRIYLGVHYPSDVVAGFISAAFWVLSVTFGDRLLRRGAVTRSRAQDAG